MQRAQRATVVLAAVTELLPRGSAECGDHASPCFCCAVAFTRGCHAKGQSGCGLNKPRCSDKRCRPPGSVSCVRPAEATLPSQQLCGMQGSDTGGAGSTLTNLRV